MDNKTFIAIWVFVIAVIFAQPVGINFIIDVQDIPDDDNGYQVNAQVTNNGDGTFHIAVNPKVVNDPMINKIVAHEIGHINNWDGDEAYADDFANMVVPEGEDIVDAYHGIH